MPHSDPNDQPDDWQLLRQYADAASHPAFEQLVRRYVDFVYSMARRRTANDPHLPQAVFVLLSQKARTLGRAVILSGWLHHATRHVAANALKRESRRKRHERAAAFAQPARESHMHPPATRHDESADWEAVAPLLETALDHLAAPDRNPLRLRFIRGQSHRDVGHAMRIAQDAARNRVERALPRLRNFFASRGVTLPALTLATLLATRAVDAAPPALAASASTLAAGAGASLAQAAAATMAWANAKLFAACVAATLLVSTAAVVTVQALKPPARPIAQAPSPTLPARPVVQQQPNP